MEQGKEWIYDSTKQEYVALNIKNKIEQDVVNRMLSEERMVMHFENYLKML
jgi:hypothetical protein